MNCCEIVKNKFLSGQHVDLCPVSHSELSSVFQIKSITLNTYVIVSFALILMKPAAATTIAVNTKSYVLIASEPLSSALFVNSVYKIYFFDFRMTNW